MDRALGLLPWVLAFVAVVAFPLLLGPVGFAYSLLWSTALVLVRRIAGDDRERRLASDALAAVGCFLGAYLGGWYLLPSVAAFAILDLRGPRILKAPSSRDLAFTAGIGSAVAGIMAASLLVLGRLYATATSIAGQDGARDTIASNETFLEVTGAAGFAVVAVLVSCSVAMLFGTATHRARRRIARPLFVLGALGFSLVAVLGALSVGLYVAPSAFLAWLATVASWRPVRGPSA